MAIIYVETDNNDANPPNTDCTGRTKGAQAIGIQNSCTEGGSGSGTLTVNLASSDTLKLQGEFIIRPGSTDTWDSGTWTVRLNVTTANMNLTLEEVNICRLNSSNVNQATIGSATALGISLGTTGVKSQNVTGSAQTPAAGDYVVVNLIFSNGAMSLQNFVATMGQNIDSPFNHVAGGDGTDMAWPPTDLPLMTPVAVLAI